MSPIDFGRIAVALLVSGVLAAAAISDVRVRKIPNWTVVAILCLFIPWVFLGPKVEVLPALAGAAGIFAVTFALYSAGAIGAGDSKLLTAVALYAGMGHLLQLVVLTTLAGGLLALATIVSRPMETLVVVQMRGKAESKGVPYGAAIAAGGVLTLFALIAHVGWPSTEG